MYSGKLIYAYGAKCIRCGVAGVLFAGAIGHSQADCDASLMQRGCSALERLMRHDETGHQRVPSVPVYEFAPVVTTTGTTSPVLTNSPSFYKGS